jgi:hypothetical protein
MKIYEGIVEWRYVSRYWNFDYFCKKFGESHKPTIQQ